MYRQELVEIWWKKKSQEIDKRRERVKNKVIKIIKIINITKMCLIVNIKVIKIHQFNIILLICSFMKVKQLKYIFSKS